MAEIRYGHDERYESFFFFLLFLFISNSAGHKSSITLIYWTLHMCILLVIVFFSVQSFIFNSIADIEVAFRNLLAFLLHFRPQEFSFTRFTFSTYARTYTQFFFLTQLLTVRITYRQCNAMQIFLFLSFFLYVHKTINYICDDIIYLCNTLYYLD